MAIPQTVPHSKRTEGSINANSDIRLVDETVQPKTFRDKSVKLSLNARLRKHQSPGPATSIESGQRSACLKKTAGGKNQSQSLVPNSGSFSLNQQSGENIRIKANKFEARRQPNKLVKNNYNTMSDLSTTIAHPSNDGHYRPFIEAGTGVLTPTSTLHSQILTSNAKAKRDGRNFTTVQQSPARAS